MRVYMLKDVEKVGMAGQIIEVSDGYAKNFLFPKKLAVNAAGAHAASYEKRVIKETVEKQVINSKMEMLAERIKTLHVTLKERCHDDGKLYGSVGADEVIELLKEKDINVNKKQIEFDKTVKATGEHKVTVKLSSKLKPQFTLKVVAK